MNYVGFYWTRPVFWAGFNSLPADVDDAAKVSKTIRYQREVIRRYVRDHRGSLVGEFVYLDQRADGATIVIQAELRSAERLCKKEEAKLIIVDSRHQYGWRRNKYLMDYIFERKIPYVALPADEIIMDGRLFDPISHFEDWRERESAWRSRKLDCNEQLVRLLMEAPEGMGRWTRISEALNRGGVKTANGKSWTVDSVRKRAMKLKSEGYLENETNWEKPL